MTRQLASYPHPVKLRPAALAGWLILVILTPPTSRAQKLELFKDLTIGAADGPPEYAFGRIDVLAPTSRQAFFIFDGADTQIRRYDPQGHFRGVVGRSGSGPGEYRQVAGMAVHGDSLLLVYDPANGRIAVFDSSGRYRRQITLTRIGTFYGEKMFAVDRAGLIAIRTALGTGPREGMTVPSQYLRMRLDGTIVDSIPVPATATEGWPFVLITADGARWSFPDQTVFTLLPDGGIASARTITYRVSVAPRQGLAFLIQRAERPIKIEGPERAEWEAYIRYFASRPQTRAPSPIPPVKPLIRDLLADDTGRLWIHRYMPAVKRNIPPRPAGDARPLLTIREVNSYDLFDPGGTFLGNIALPPHAMLLAVRGDRVYVRQEAGAGEYLVERYVVRGMRRP